MFLNLLGKYLYLKFLVKKAIKMSNVLACLLTMLFAIISARMESIIWQIHTCYIKKNYEDELHFIFVLIRVLFAYLIAKIITDYNWGVYCIGIFFYLHKSALFFFRNKENPNIYEKGWFSTSSPTSGSWLDKNFPYTGTHEFRLLFLIISVLLTITFA